MLNQNNNVNQPINSLNTIKKPKSVSFSQTKDIPQKVSSDNQVNLNNQNQSSLPVLNIKAKSVYQPYSYHTMIVQFHDPESDTWFDPLNVPVVYDYELRQWKMSSTKAGNIIVLSGNIMVTEDDKLLIKGAGNMPKPGIHCYTGKFSIPEMGEFETDELYIELPPAFPYFNLNTDNGPITIPTTKPNN